MDRLVGGSVAGASVGGGVTNASATNTSPGIQTAIAIVAFGSPMRALVLGSKVTGIVGNEVPKRSAR